MAVIAVRPKIKPLVRGAFQSSWSGSYRHQLVHSEQVAVTGSQVGSRTPGSFVVKVPGVTPVPAAAAPGAEQAEGVQAGMVISETEIGRASCRERVCKTG